MTSPHPQLRVLAEDFAGTLTSTLTRFLGRPEQFSVGVEGHTGHMIISTSPGGVSLSSKDRVLLALRVEYRCTMDRTSTYLSVDDSIFSIHLGPSASSEPLFRYEYVRGLKAVLPSAHLHIHAHRSQVGYAMGLSSERNREHLEPTGKRLAEAAELKRIHFPLGGARFRPCLEDVLEMLVTEFDIDRAPEWAEVLAHGKTAWRRIQTAAVVRDCAPIAVEALRGLGYQVELPAQSHHPENHRYLTSR